MKRRTSPSLSGGTTRASSGRDSDGQSRRYGFELTFFQTLRGRLPPYYIAHFAIT